MEKENWSVRINENNGIPIGHPKQILPPVLDSIPDLRYWSDDALVIFHNGLIDLECEMAEKMEKKDKRWISQISKQQIKFYTHREEVLQRIYIRALSAEGLGPLSGFCMSAKMGDTHAKNPEYTPMTTRKQ